MGIMPPELEKETLKGVMPILIAIIFGIYWLVRAIFILIV